MRYQCNIYILRKLVCKLDKDCFAEDPQDFGYKMTKLTEAQHPLGPWFCTTPLKSAFPPPPSNSKGPPRNNLGGPRHFKGGGGLFWHLKVPIFIIPYINSQFKNNSPAVQQAITILRFSITPFFENNISQIYHFMYWRNKNV